MILHTMIFERGDVVLVPFPFSDQRTSKKRPAVIVSSNRHNELSSDVFIMAITSKTRNADDSVDYVIEDWKKAGLVKPSLMKPAISTIERKLIIRKLGGLSSRDMESLERALRGLFGLNP